MNKEEKQILLIDLSARYPYGVIIHSIWDYQELSGRIKRKETVRTMESYDFCDYWNCKPYLRPMSSMTEQEKRELSAKYNWSIRGNDISIRYHSEGYWNDDTECPTNEYLELFDWLNAHHFDYRGLIEKGFAIEVTKENNPYKE